MHPLNYLNSLFYSYCPQAFTTSGLADFFITAHPVQEGLYAHISSRFSYPIRLKEICAGPHTDRWDYLFSHYPKLNWDITLTDFSPLILPHTYHSLVEDLFQPPATLPPSDRFHVILTTYGFDSLWFPQDIHLQKRHGQWFRSQFSYPNQLPQNTSLSQLSQFHPSLSDIPIDISTLPYGDIIASYYQHFSDLSFNFPGGLIHYVQEVFPRQLKPDGIFITGDVAYSSTLSSDSPHQPPYDTIGQVAKFQALDYGLVKHILQPLGFNIEIITLNTLLEKYNLTFPLDLRDHLIMSISNN